MGVAPELLVRSEYLWIPNIRKVVLKVERSVYEKAPNVATEIPPVLNTRQQNWKIPRLVLELRSLNSGVH